MIIEKIVIRNYKIFENFELAFNDDLNIIIGDNETGKSTLFEAINLALSCQLNGRYIKNELSPYIFNKKTNQEYLDKLEIDDKTIPPSILIELYFKDEEYLTTLKGTNNSKRELYT